MKQIKKTIKVILISTILLLLFLSFLYNRTNLQISSINQKYNIINLTLNDYLKNYNSYVLDLQKSSIILDMLNNKKIDSTKLKLLKSKISIHNTTIINNNNKIIFHSKDLPKKDTIFKNPQADIQINYKNKEINLFITTPIKSQNNKQIGTIITKVDRSLIDELINKFSTPVFITTKNGTILSSNQKNTLFKNINKLYNKHSTKKMTKNSIALRNLEFYLYQPYINFNFLLKIIIIIYFIFMFLILKILSKKRKFKFKNINRKKINSIAIFIIFNLIFLITGYFHITRENSNRYNSTRQKELLSNTVISKEICLRKIKFNNIVSNFKINKIKDNIIKFQDNNLIIYNISKKQFLTNNKLIEKKYLKLNDTTITYNKKNWLTIKKIIIKKDTILFAKIENLDLLIKNLKPILSDEYKIHYNLKKNNANNNLSNNLYIQKNIYLSLNLENKNNLLNFDIIFSYLTGFLFSIFISLFYYFFSNNNEALKKIVLSKTAQLERLLEQNRKTTEKLKKMTYIVEQSPIGIVLTDVDANIVYANSSFQKITKYEFNELIGQNCRILKSDKYDQTFYANFWHDIINGKMVKIDFGNINKLGEEYIQRDIISAVTNDRKETIGYVGFAEDVTEQIKMEIDKNNMEIHLRQSQKMEAIGELAAGIAHEINTPIQYIANNIDYIDQSLKELLEILEQLNNSKDLDQNFITKFTEEINNFDLDFFNDESKEAIKQSKEGISKITEIVKAMRDFSHPGQKHKSVEDLKKIASNSIIITKNQWKYVSNIKTNFPDTPMELLCFPQELGQLFINLIVNAANAIEDVVKENNNMGLITISLSNEDGFYIISIKDTGTGIKEENQDKIFNPFFTTKEVGKGTGQGLAFVHKIAKKHNGFLSLKTKWGEGTEFIIRLPIQKNELTEEE